MKLSPKNNKILLIIGCGYVASHLIKKHQNDFKDIIVTHRTKQEGCLVFNDIDSIDFKQLQNVTHILISIPPNEKGDIFFNKHYADILSLKKLTWIGYLSSTSVYGDHKGNWVDELSNTVPNNIKGRNRIIAESQYLSKFKDQINIFRLSGIYGPKRSIIDQIKNNNIKAINSTIKFSRIHVEDIVQTIMRSINYGSYNEIFNLADDLPAATIYVIKYASNLLNVKMPKILNLEDPEISDNLRSFYLSSKLVSNIKIKNFLGVKLKFPSYKEGLLDYMRNFKEVEVVPYDSNWPLLFEVESNKIKKALGSNFKDIHHVGSTAVLGLDSKPKIDIIASVDDLVFSYEGLTKLNYEYRGGFNLPLRKSFTYRSADLNINLHIFELNDPEIELNLIFRDYLRTHPEVKKQYAALKYKLLKEDLIQTNNGLISRGYTLGKHDLIQDILKKSGYNRLRFVICAHYAEIEYAKNYRNKYFLEQNQEKDIYAETFEHKDHKHFIFYKGVEMVGYAHIQILTKNQFYTHIIVIDQKYRDKNYDKEFGAMIKKWQKLN